MKPHIICHMASSLDGRILPSRWMPEGVHDHAIYEDLHARLGGGSWIVGRVTGAEFAKGEDYSDDCAETYSREAWLPQMGADAYAFVIDAKGKIAWGRSEVGGDPIVVILTEAVSDSHLAGLRKDGVGYLFAGETELDLTAAMATVRRELGIEQVLLEGGGVVNGEFLRAGLIAEISLMLEPVIDGAKGAPSTFDSATGDAAKPPLAGLVLKAHEVLAGGILWLRYDVMNA